MIIKSIKNALKKIPLVKPSYDFIKQQKEFVDNYFAYLRLKKVSKKSKHKLPIKVGFVTQVPECWQKIEPVFNEMLKRKEFEVFVILVPPYDISKQKVGDYSKETDFFANLVDNKHTFKYEDFDLSSVDYLFYQRPYDPVYPDKLKSKNASKYIKLCYIPYATTEMKYINTRPLSFFRNLSIAFLEDDSCIELVKAKFNQNFDFQYNRFLNIGYPSFEQLLTLKTLNKSTRPRVLWTPRWSYDPIVGGSHFFEYVDYFTVIDREKVELSIRPHPLMWDNFLREKRITVEQINDLKKKWKNNGIIVDLNKNLLDTFKNTDIMISDRSSVISMFFMTGKPIIYCEFCPDEYSEMFKKFLPGLYIVNTQQELSLSMNRLINGIDPLAGVRKSIIKSFEHHKYATINIVNYIENDYTLSESIIS